MTELQTHDDTSGPEMEANRADPPVGPSGGFLEELRKRKVYQTTAIYVAASWAVIQFADIAVPRLGLPNWSVDLAIWLMFAGLPVVIVLSWVFEIKSHGSSSFPIALTRFFSSVRFVALWLILFVVAVIVATVVFGGVPRTSFALAPRDSVVVGPFQNFTGNSLLDNSLELALRVAFEQSRYANVVPQARVQQTLAQMMVDGQSGIGRDTAVQVALRERAKALVIGSIGEVGATYKLSVEVIEPSSARTVLLETATVASTDEILVALDDMTRDIRSKLGESVDELAETTPELDRVTTANLEALRAYSLGIRAAGRGDVQDALDLFERAISLDPEFSMAHAKLATIYESALENRRQASIHRELALRFSDRLTERERLYVEASQTRDGKPADMIRAWRLMRALFPDEAVAHHNLATVYWRYDNAFQEAADSFAAAAAIDNPWSHLSQHYLGYVQLGLGQFDLATENLEQATQQQSVPIDGGLADAYLAAGAYGEAEEFLSQAREVANVQLQIELDFRWIDLYVDQGYFNEGLTRTEVAVDRAKEMQSGGLETRALAARLAIMERTADSVALDHELQSQIELSHDLLGADESVLGFSPIEHLLILGKIAARNGRSDLSERIFADVASKAEDSGFFFREAYIVLLAGEIALARGDASEAIDMFLRAAPETPLFQVHESLARAYEAAGELPAALAEYEWMGRHRGLPFAEVIAGLHQREFSLIDWSVAQYHLGRLNEQLGDDESAIRHYRSFLDQWSARESSQPLTALAASRLASLQNQDMSGR